MWHYRYNGVVYLLLLKLRGFTKAHLIFEVISRRHKFIWSCQSKTLSMMLNWSVCVCVRICLYICLCKDEGEGGGKGERDSVQRIRGSYENTIMVLKRKRPSTVYQTTPVESLPSALPTIQKKKCFTSGSKMEPWTRHRAKSLLE